MTAILIPDDDAGRLLAVDALRVGGIVAIPTDTVYGLAVDLATQGGIERLFHVKRRPPDKGIVLLLADPEQALEVAAMPPAAMALAEACWPGGLTIVVEQRPEVALPPALTGGARTIGLRVADHEASRAIARALGPLPVTSANVSGQPDATTAADVAAISDDGIALILDGGRAPGGRPSTVVDASQDPPIVLRDGAIARERLTEILGRAGFALGGV